MKNHANFGLAHVRKIVFLMGSERKKILRILPLYIFSSFLDLIGLGLLVVLLSVIRNPDATINALNSLSNWVSFFDVSKPKNVIVFISAGVLLTFTVRTMLAVIIAKITLLISFNFGARFRTFMMRVYQGQNYAKFTQRNASEYINNIQFLCGQVVSYAVLPLLRSIGDGLITIFILIFLAFENPVALLIISCLLSGVGILYDRTVRKKMVSYGTQTNELSASLIKHVTEGLTGYKESRILGIEGYFTKAVAQAAFKLSSLRVKSQLVILSSRFVLELVVVTGVVIVILSMIVIGQSNDQIISTLTIFVVACVRLVPTVNQIVVNIGNLRYGKNAVNTLYDEIIEAGYRTVDLSEDFKSSNKRRDARHSIETFHSLQLQNVAFKYPSSGKPILRDISLHVERNDIIAVTGPSGAGKSTIMALILGLLQPTTGRVLHNGSPLTSDAAVEAWHQRICYLPQDVFIIDDTIVRNVALGMVDAEIDRDRALDALKRAHLGNFIKELPDGMDTYVGDRGARLSGGQRQRLALARAFYFNAEVLILDESTSAIDKETTTEILTEIANLRGHATIILITHQAPMLSLCNKIYALDDGIIKLQETNR